MALRGPLPSLYPRSPFSRSGSKDLGGPAELGQGGAWAEEGLTQEVTFLGRGGDGEDRSQLPKEQGCGAHPQARPGSSRGNTGHTRAHTGTHACAPQERRAQHV